MYYKRIVPKEMNGQTATHFVAQIILVLGDITTMKYQVEFYDETNSPIRDADYDGEVSGLPASEELIQQVKNDPHRFSYDTVEALLQEHRLIVLDAIRHIYDLTYYDESFELRPELSKFSFQSVEDISHQIPPEYREKVGRLTCVTNN